MASGITGVTGAGLSGLGAVYGAAFAGKGQIFEGAPLSIHAQVAVRENVARVLLRYTNTSAAPLQGFKTALQQIPQVASSAIAGGGVIEQQVQFKANDYFVEPPKLAVAYTMQGVERQAMTWVPVHVAKFNTPVECTKEQYFSVWGRVTEAPNMSVSVCKCGAGSSRAAVQALVAALNYSILQGVDPNANNIVGAAKMKLANGGGEADCFSVVRLEMQVEQELAVAVKLTVKSNKPAVTEACRAAFVLLLSK